MNLEQLYTEHYKSVYYTCYKYLQNEEDAKDMAQNVFIKAFDKIDTLKDTSSFKSWINRIAANECINELKKTNRIKLEELTATSSEGESFEHIEDASQKNPEEVVVDDDVRDILLHIINKLPQDQRIAVHLYYYQDMTVKEISQIFGCSEQTTRNRLGYARKNIKKEVDKLEDKGVQLRSIALLPFLYLIFQAEESFAQVAVPAYSTLSATESVDATVANAEMSSSAEATNTATTSSGAASTTTATASTAATAASSGTAATATTAAAVAGATKSAVLFGLSMKTVIAAIVSIAVVTATIAVAVLPKGDSQDKENNSQVSSDSTPDKDDNDNLDDTNVNTDADKSWGKVIIDKKIDLSHTFLGSHNDSHLLYDRYGATSSDVNGDYYIIPLNDKYNYYETPNFIVESTDYSNFIEYTEPSELHYEYNENLYQDLKGPVYVVKKDTASDVIANKEYLTPEANIDLGEVLINGHTLKLPCKASYLAQINLGEINLGESLSITNGTMIEKYPGADTYSNSGEIEYFNINDSKIMLDPKEILVISCTYTYPQIREDNGHQTGLIKVSYILYNDADTPTSLGDCMIYGVNTFLHFNLCLDTANVWPQVCFPGYVSYAASREYVMKQYGIPVAVTGDWPEGITMFEGDNYCCILGTRLVDVPTIQHCNTTYFMMKDELKEFVKENFD